MASGKRKSHPPDLQTRLSALAILREVAKRHRVPACLIVSHSAPRETAASNARKEVQRTMIEKLGMKRAAVAWMFDRDLRRVRASELGQKPDRKYCRKTGRLPRYRELLVTVGSQFYWIECAPVDGCRGKRRLPGVSHHAPTAAAVQFVLAFLSWRVPVTHRCPSRLH